MSMIGLSECRHDRVDQRVGPTFDVCGDRGEGTGKLGRSHDGPIARMRPDDYHITYGTLKAACRTRKPE